MFSLYFQALAGDQSCDFIKFGYTPAIHGFNKAYNTTHYLMPDSTVTELGENETNADYKIIKRH